MSKWLASVQSLEEAKKLTETLPDILDLKDPHTGALGALPTATVKTIVDWVNGRCQTSATVGDLVMHAGVVTEAVKQMATTGVDYVKVGLFAGPDLEDCLMALTEQPIAVTTPLIAVLFADRPVDLRWIETIKQAGFHGVMVDTADKNGRRLLDHWDRSMLGSFVSAARRHKLLCGLAGALTIEDIELLAPLQADYLGFRSALCVGRQRTQDLQSDKARAIQQCLQRFSPAG